MASSHFGRRRRRVRRAVTTLLTVAIMGSLIGYFAYQKLRPEAYRPGEEHDEITTKLHRSLPEGAPNPIFVDVDGDDFLAWQAEFGSGVASTGSSRAVPEPSSWLLLLAGLAAAVRLRRRAVTR